MSWVNATYLYERNYDDVISETLNQENIEYWEKVIGKDELKCVMAYYNLNVGKLFGIVNYTYSEGDFEAITIMEKQYIKWRKNKQIDMDYSSKKQIIFKSFFTPFLKFTIDYYRKMNGECTSIEQSLAANLLKRLVQISSGILMFEMQLNKNEGNLKGNDPKEEYIDYNESFLKKEEYINDLFEIYPCLKRLIFETIYNFYINYSEIYKRYKSDYNELRTLIFEGKELGNLVKVDASVSDSHHAGKTVAILHFENGQRIVYKPRNLQPECAYQRYILDIQKGCKLAMKTFKIINHDKYGWEEYIQAKECTDKKEVENYYYRFGVLIFINYILNVNDLHGENVIAAGEYPVIIDAETILDNVKYLSEKNARLTISSYIHESVLYSGLLPYYRFARKGKPVNMGAINGTEGEEYPILVPVVKEPGTSNMHYGYVHPVTHANNNLVKINGDFIKPDLFANQICDGFEDAYRYVMENKSYFIEHSSIFEDMSVRHLIQDTQRYSMILHTSYHPFFMQNGCDRNLFMGKMFNHYEQVQSDKGIVGAEIAEMLRGDIPYFTLNTSKKSLFGNDGATEFTGYFEETSIERLKKKVAKMSSQQMEEQKRFIRISLTDLNKSEKDMSVFSFDGASSKDEYADHGVIEIAVEKIVNELLNSVKWGAKKEDANWLGISIIGESENPFWNIQPLNNYLYDGVAGIAIFLRAYAKVFNTSKYNDLSDAVENNLFMYTKEILEDGSISNVNTGAFSGEAGIVYTYLLLYEMTGNKLYLNFAEKHAAIVGREVINDTSYDLMFGNAGALLVLIQLYKHTNNAIYLKMAESAGEKLIIAQEKKENQLGGWIGSASKNALSGFSHGAAGIVYALSKLWENTKNSNAYQSILLGLEFERNLYDDSHKNWIDRRNKTKDEIEKYGCFMTAWCHGAAGILLGRTKIYNILPKELSKSIKDEINIAIQTTLKNGMSNNPCLCHGSLGNTEIIMEYARLSEDESLLQYCKNIRRDISKYICKDEYNFGRDYLYGYKIPGFMTGIAGMGYSLLRDIDKDLPCLLAVESTK